MPAPTELATITQHVQVGIETTLGTAVAATKQLADLTQFSATPANDVDMSQRGAGQKIATFGIVGKEMTTIAIGGPLTFDSFAYWCNLAFRTGTIGAGGDASTRYHTFDLSQTAQETYSAFTIEHGDSVRARKIPGVQLDSLSFTLDLAGNVAQWSGSGIGFPLVDGITLTGALPFVAVTPMSPANVDVFLDTTYAGAGGTRLSRVLKFDFAMSNHWDQFFTLDSTMVRHAAGMIETPPTIQVKLLLEADSAGMARLTALRAGTSQFVRVKVIGPVAGSSTQNLQVDMALKISSAGAIEDKNGVYGYEVTGDLVYDLTGTASLKFRLENLLTAL